MTSGVTTMDPVAVDDCLPVPPAICEPVRMPV